MAGEIMGAEESLSPEQALALYTSELDAPGVSHRKIAIGEKANICLLDRAWYSARQNLAEVNVKLTLRHGKVIHSA
jgi:predicted amidohydrolase YtcJ